MNSQERLKECRRAFRYLAASNALDRTCLSGRIDMRKFPLCIKKSTELNQQANRILQQCGLLPTALSN